MTEIKEQYLEEKSSRINEKSNYFERISQIQLGKRNFEID